MNKEPETVSRSITRSEELLGELEEFCLKAGGGEDRRQENFETWVVARLSLLEVIIEKAVLNGAKIPNHKN